MRFKKGNRWKSDKEHKKILIAYDIEMILNRITLAYDGEFFYRCTDNNIDKCILQEHEIQSWK